MTYSALYGSAGVRFLGNGFFVLEESLPPPDPGSRPPRQVWDDEHPGRLRECPFPLIPSGVHPRRFFESLLEGRRVLQAEPGLPAQEFYARMSAWARHAIGRWEVRQDGFDAWYAAGLCAYIDIIATPDQPVELTLGDETDLTVLRAACLRHVVDRIKGMSELVTMLQAEPGLSSVGINFRLAPSGLESNPAGLRLYLLQGFAAVRNEGDAWQLTPTGEALAQELADPS